ncbi:MAG: diaminopimelate epimerase [Rhodospirillales bacterium]
MRFLKMHGLGNDFVVLDGRHETVTLTPEQILRIADRKTGVGFDQLILIGTGDGAADAAMRIFNADGSEVDACGNATRCVGRLLLGESGAKAASIRTGAGLLTAFTAGGTRISVDMGAALLEPSRIPVDAVDSLHLPIEEGPLRDPVGVGMGNPHAVFFVDDVQAIDLEVLGPKLEHHPLFPAKANISIAQVTGPVGIRLRVWERGVGITRACGTAACATAVAGHRRGLTERTVTITLDGGDLELTWRKDGRVIMTGETALSFEGTLAPELLA